MLRRLFFIAAFAVFSTTAGEVGSTPPEVLNGLVFVGTIKPANNNKAKGEAITLICKDDNIESPWLSERGVKDLTSEPGGFSDKHISFHAATVTTSENKAEMDVSVDDLKKLKATLTLHSKGGGETVWLIEAKKQKPPK